MLNDILGQINDLMYTYLLLFLLLGTGLYFSIRSRFAQVRLMKEGFRILTEKAEVEDGKRQVSSFQALMISTASRVGTGNIAGIATAIAAGGPGAVFWMWVMAVIGSASAFIESTLAQVYKTKDGKDFRGGPSYYMEKALGKRWMGVLFSVLLIICFAYILLLNVKCVQVIRKVLKNWYIELKHAILQINRLSSSPVLVLHPLIWIGC